MRGIGEWQQCSPGEDHQKQNNGEVLVKAIRNSVVIGRSRHDNVRANINVWIKRLLENHGYSPVNTATACEVILRQVETPLHRGPAN